MAKKIEPRKKVSSRKLRAINDIPDLNDDNLVPELEKRIRYRSGGLGFISDSYLKNKLSNLSSYLRDKTDDESELNPDEVSPLWGKLIEESVSYLKIKDKREWKEQWGNPNDGSRWNLKAFGAEKLQKYFEQFMEFEKVLYGAVDYYRNHSLHVFRVWMLGAILLADMLRDNKYPEIQVFGNADETNNRYTTGNKVSIQKKEIQAMWCIIALSHDLGYPLQKTDSVNEQTRKMLRSYARVNVQDLSFDVPHQHQFINDFILKFISSKSVAVPKEKEEDEQKYKTHIQSKYYLKFSKSLEEYEHGIFSAIILMKNLTYFLESDFDLDELKPMSEEDARQCAIRREILRAIASHTCEQIYHLHPYTLSFLLIVCDELQSWGRPTFEEMQEKHKKRVKSKLCRFTPDAVEYELRLPEKESGFIKRTRSIFKKHHKLFRAAVDAPSRGDCECIIRVFSREDINDMGEFRFRFKSYSTEENCPPQFEFNDNNDYWDIYNEKEPERILNRSTNHDSNTS